MMLMFRNEPRVPPTHRQAAEEVEPAERIRVDLDLTPLTATHKSMGSNIGNGTMQQRF